MQTIEDKKENNMTELQQKYTSFLSKIFNWGVFRNKAPADRTELDLKPMQDLCERFNNPQVGNYKIIQVAGTNGKGSVSLKTARSLQELGYTVGMFTSPHISCFRERYQINGELCSMQDTVDICQNVFDEVIENNLDIRFFEIVTIIGFLMFKKYKCDYVVLECGLGARLDATNVAQYPDVICSTITSIGLDHVDVLGSTLEDIAREKAFIIKSDIPCVLGPTCINLEEINKRLDLTTNTDVH